MDRERQCEQRFHMRYIEEESLWPEQNADRMRKDKKRWPWVWGQVGEPSAFLKGFGLLELNTVGSREP